MTRSIGNQGHRRHHRWVLSLDAVATLGFAALSALACCGWLVIQWLSLALYAVGGAAAFHVLIRYEAPILLALGVVELVAARLARDRVGRLVNVALGALAIGIGALRLAWDLDRSLVQTAPLLYVVFVYRQQILLVALGLAVALRVAGWLVARRQTAASECCVPERGKAAAIGVKRFVMEGNYDEAGTSLSHGH